MSSFNGAALTRENKIKIDLEEYISDLSPSKYIYATKCNNILGNACIFNTSYNQSIYGVYINNVEKVSLEEIAGKYCKPHQFNLQKIWQLYPLFQIFIIIIIFKLIMILLS